MFDLTGFLVKRAKTKHSVAVRAIATLLGATLFLVGFPALVVWAGSLLPNQVFPILPARITALVLIIIGLPMVIQSVAWQLLKGNGTPVPIVPTTTFLKNGPYRYSRNPMMLGFFLYLFSWVLSRDQAGSLLCAIIIMLLLLAWIKLVEEPELTKRFGEAYTQYKKETPFMIPRFRSNSAAKKTLTAVFVLAFLVLLYVSGYCYEPCRKGEVYKDPPGRFEVVIAANQMGTNKLGVDFFDKKNGFTYAVKAHDAAPYHHELPLSIENVRDDISSEIEKGGDYQVRVLKEQRSNFKGYEALDYDIAISAKGSPGAPNYSYGRFVRTPNYVVWIYMITSDPPDAVVVTNENEVTKAADLAQRFADGVTLLK